MSSREGLRPGFFSVTSQPTSHFTIVSTISVEPCLKKSSTYQSSAACPSASACLQGA